MILLLLKAYDVLVALLEASDKPRRRLAAENVAKHLLSRPTNQTTAVRSDSGMGNDTPPVPSLDTTWDTEYSSSGYSQTTASSSSTNSSTSPGDTSGAKPTHQELKVIAANTTVAF